MKSNEKLKRIISLTIGIALTFSFLITTNLNFFAGTNNTSTGYRDDINLDNENLRLSKVSGKIYINGNSEWLTFKNDGNCTGNGTYSDPYIIEDLVIDGGGSGSGILIENSDVYFRIENSTVYNSYYGIRLNFANNGTLIENNCSDNSYGIYLWYSDNNTLIDNNIWNSLYNGFYINNSDDNYFSGNKVWNTLIYSGTALLYSNRNNLSGNEAWNNDDVGIWIGTGSYDNILIGNDVWENQWGITLESSYNSTVSENNAWNNSDDGIAVYYSNDNTLTGNEAWNNTNCGIVIDTSLYDNVLIGNDVWENQYGIMLYYSNNSIVSENNAWNNTEIGILVYYSNDNTFIGNKAWKNEWGYFLQASDNNNLTGNDAWNNILDGILLWVDTDNNILAKNSLWSNNRTGIVLSDSNQNNLTENEAWNNTAAGFYVGTNSGRNNLVGNNAWNNNDKGFYLNDSSDNFLSGNSAWNNFYGILLNSSINETIISNTVSDNNTFGIYLSNSTQNLLSLNNVSNNYEYGIYIDENSTDNKIWLNFLYGNIMGQASDNGTGNMWDNGFAGNYWGDYVVRYPGASDIGGIWDTPYDISGNTGSADNYPLVLPVLEDLIPTAQITANATQINYGQWVQFNDASTGGNAPFSYQWNFGDGTANSTEINPKYQFNLPGSYTVILTVTDLDGDISIITKESFITVIDLIPVADFTANATLISLSNNIVQFQFTGTEGDGPATFQWNFGDGTANSTERNPTHQYTLSGTYSVILTITDADGDTDVLIRIEYIIVQSEPTTAIPGYNIFFLLGVMCALSVIINKRNKKFKS